MPKNPSLLPAGVRISDRLAVGCFQRSFPKDAVLGALARQGRETQRERELPNEAVVYLSMALAIYRDASQPEVLRCVAEGLSWLNPRRELKITGRSGISQARTRVGWQPLKDLFETCAKPLAKPDAQGAFYRGRRLVALDGTSFNLDDCSENEEAFGRPANQLGAGSYPQARLVGLVECGTHALFAAEIGRYADSELTLAVPVIQRSLKPGMLCLADRLFASYHLVKMSKEFGAEILCRCRMDRRLPREVELQDGSFLSTIYSSDDRSREKPLRVRIIEYDVVNTQSGEVSPFRLMTTLLDPSEAPAQELAELYPERWEFEITLDELKVHLNDNVKTLRSKTPDLVRQEIYGLIMAHYAIRAIMYDAADSCKLDPDELSFVHSVRVVRRKLPGFGNFSPSSIRRKFEARSLARARLLEQGALK